MESMDQPASATEPEGAGLGYISSRGVLAGTIALTALEWIFYFGREAIACPAAAVVPILLFTSLVKLTAVVYGMTRLEADPGLGVKVACAGLISAGGVALAFVELLG